MIQNLGQQKVFSGNIWSLALLNNADDKKNNFF